MRRSFDSSPRRTAPRLWTDTSFLRNPRDHGASDLPETLDFTFMARIAELLAASLSP